jgi:hypothetical protein
MRAALRRLGIVSGFVFALGALAGVRTLERGKQELAESDRAFAAGQVELALRHAERAALLYVPGASHVEAAYLRLESLALGAEQEGDRVLAARAWRAVRSAVLQSRHVWLPRRQALERADSNLERLGDSSVAPGSFDAAPSAQRGSLGGLAVALGFIVAIGSLGWLGTAALTPRGAWLWRRARWPLSSLLVGVLSLGWALLSD